jgi:hypothetical protein
MESLRVIGPKNPTFYASNFWKLITPSNWYLGFVTPSNELALQSIIEGRFSYVYVTNKILKSHIETWHHFLDVDFQILCPLNRLFRSCFNK